MLAAVFQPDVLRQVADLGQKIIFPELVNGRIDHDHTHPSHQDHLEVFCTCILEFGKIAEDFNKIIIHHIHGLIIPVNVSENCFQAIAIIFLVKESLVLWVVLYTTFNNILQ